MVPGEFLLEFAGLLFVILLLGFLDEGNDVSHTEDTVRDARRVEHIQGFHLLARRYELDGLADDSLDGERGTASGVAVHLGQDDSVEIQPVVESLGCLDGILSGHGVHDEQCLGRMHGLMQGGNLVHQLLVDGQTAGGIDNDNAVSFALRSTDGVLRYDDGVLDTFLGIYGDIYLRAERLQLVDGGGTESVARHEQDLHPPLALDMVGELGGERGLTGSVQTGHQHDAGLALDIDVSVLAAHELGQFVVDDLDHHLLRLDRGEDVLSHRLGLDPVAEILGNLVTYIGVEQGPADVLQGLGDIDIGNLPFALQYLEGTFKSLR